MPKIRFLHQMFKLIVQKAKIKIGNEGFGIKKRVITNQIIESFDRIYIITTGAEHHRRMESMRLII